MCSVCSGRTESRGPPGKFVWYACSLDFTARGKASGMTERRYPPGDVGPARMLAGRPGLNARHCTRVVMCSVCSGRTERRYQPGKIRLVRMLAGRQG